MSRELKLAALCGTIPLVSGLSIYIAWRITRSEWLISVGGIDILLGFVFVVIGGIVLLLHCGQASSPDPGVVQHERRRVQLVSALLAVNFPVAAYCVFSAIEVDSRYVVQVRNESDVAFDSFSLTAPGVNIEYGPIAPGDVVSRHMHFTGDGTLTFESAQGDIRFTGEVDGYVTTGLGGQATIHITEPGKYTVQHAQADDRLR